MMSRQLTCLYSLALCTALFALVGCSGSVHPVKGQVVWKDTGKPATEIAGAIITFEQAGSETSARGQIEADGSFQLTTTAEHDGAKVGEHTVLIMEIGRHPQPGGDGSQLSPGKVSTKYASPSSSDIKVTIKPGLNQPKIEVERFTP